MDRAGSPEKPVATYGTIRRHNSEYNLIFTYLQISDPMSTITSSSVSNIPQQLKKNTL
jgi:hypothetical protein